MKLQQALINNNFRASSGNLCRYRAVLKPVEDGTVIRSGVDCSWEQPPSPEDIAEANEEIPKILHEETDRLMGTEGRIGSVESHVVKDTDEAKAKIDRYIETGKVWLG